MCNVALDNSTHIFCRINSNIISRINRSHQENERSFTDSKRYGIACVIIFPCFGLEKPRIRKNI